MYHGSKYIPSHKFFSFAEFPQPGDTKKHLLPIFDDPDESKRSNIQDMAASLERDHGDTTDYWMPVICNAS